MRTFAVVINLIQIAIIAGLFLTRGIALGAGVVASLFLLMLFALINLLVLLFHSKPASTRHAAGYGQKTGLVKRQKLRVMYIGPSQPVLAVGERHFPVLDLSENGIRISVDRQAPLKKHFRGQLTLLSSTVLPLKLTLVRRQGNETALSFKQPVDYAILLAEKQLAQR